MSAMGRSRARIAPPRGVWGWSSGNDSAASPPLAYGATQPDSLERAGRHLEVVARERGGADVSRGALERSHAVRVRVVAAVLEDIAAKRDQRRLEVDDDGMGVVEKNRQALLAGSGFGKPSARCADREA